MIESFSTHCTLTLFCIIKSDLAGSLERKRKWSPTSACTYTKIFCLIHVQAVFGGTYFSSVVPSPDQPLLLYSVGALQEV